MKIEPTSNLRTDPFLQQTGFGRVSVLILGLCLIFVSLFVWGIFWPRYWQARVPLTNMSDVEKKVGKPFQISTNSDGIIKWDYTLWWSGPAKVYFNTNGDVHRVFTDW